MLEKVILIFFYINLYIFKFHDIFINKSKENMKLKEIKLYMSSVREFLINKYGEMKPEWESTLFILQDTLLRYSQIKKEIDKNGLYDVTSGRKNPLLSTEKDCIATILKLTQKLGVSPWDFTKLDNGDSDNEDEDDFLSSLTE